MILRNARRAAPLAAGAWLLLLYLPLPARGDAAARWTIDDVIRMEDASDFRIAPDGRSVVWVRHVPDRDKNESVSNLFLSSLVEEREIQLTRGNESCVRPRWSPDGRLIAFLTTRSPAHAQTATDEKPATQLWLINPFGGEPWPITTQADGVQSFCWSGPNTIVFAAVHKEESKAAEEPKDTTIVVDEPPPPIRLFELALPDKKIRPLTKNADRIDFFEVSPDGRHAVTFHQRSPHFDFDNKIRPVYFLYDLKTGEGQQIFTDRKFYLEYALWSPDGRGFYAANAFTSDRRYLLATVSELYYFDLASKSARKVELDWERGLASLWDNENAVSISPTNDGFLALLANGVHNELARYTRAGERWQRTPLPGPHSGHRFGLTATRDGRTIIYPSSTSSQPPQWYRAKMGAARVEEPVDLTRLNEHLKDRRLARTEVIRWRGARDEEVEGILYYPHDYQAGRRYPLVVLIHGGPALVDFDAWDESWSHPQNLLCQRGAFVLKPNYHGSTNYGLAWVESIAGRYYDLELPDINKGVDALIARGLVDPERLGVSGHSNGAILAAALTVESTRWRAAACMAGTVEQTSDWGMSKYGASYDDYYLGASPFAEPSLYILKSPFYRLDRVRTPTLIFIGSEDNIVGPQQGWLHYRALQQHGKAPVRFLLFPGAGHELEQWTHQRRKLKEELAWFDKYLFKTTEK